MYLICDDFANFGIVKAINKVKKKDWEIGGVTNYLKRLKKIDKNHPYLSGSDNYHLGEQRTARNMSHKTEDLLRGESSYNPRTPERLTVTVGSLRGVKRGDSTRHLLRGDNRKRNRLWEDLPDLTRKPKSSEHNLRSTIKKEVLPDTNNFTDVEKVTDPGLESLTKTGYLGYRRTPQSYFQEEVPMVETGKKTKIKSRIYY